MEISSIIRMSNDSRISVYSSLGVWRYDLVVLTGSLCEKPNTSPIVIPPTFDAASSVGAIMRQFLPREYSLMNVQSRADFPVPSRPVIKRFRPLCISKSVEENSFVILTFITRSFDYTLIAFIDFGLKMAPLRQSCLASPSVVVSWMLFGA